MGPRMYWEYFNSEMGESGTPDGGNNGNVKRNTHFTNYSGELGQSFSYQR
jgi:hypothetical protein